MNVRKLLFADGVMAEGMMSRNIFAGHRLHLRHEPNLFNFHKFLCGDFEKIHFWGVFENEKPLGAGGFVEFPLNLPMEGVRCFYNSDSAVEEGARKMGIFQKLMEQQRDFFGGFKGLPFSWGIEHHPGILNGMKAYVDSLGGGDVTFIGNTCAFHVHIDQAVQAGSYRKISLRDLDKEKFLKGLKSFGSQSALYPRIDSAFLDKVSALDPEAYAIVLESGGDWTAGLLAVNLQSLRQYFEGQTPLRTLHWSLHWAKEKQSPELLRAAYSEGLKNKTQLAVVRDVPIDSMKSFEKVAMSPRRVFVMTRQSDKAKFKDLIPLIKVELDSVFS